MTQSSAVSEKGDPMFPGQEETPALFSGKVIVSMCRSPYMFNHQQMLYTPNNTAAIYSFKIHCKL